MLTDATIPLTLVAPSGAARPSQSFSSLPMIGLTCRPIEPTESGPTRTHDSVGFVDYAPIQRCIQGERRLEVGWVTRQDLH